MGAEAIPNQEETTMKTITREISLYRWDELSDRAKDKAIGMYFSEYLWGDGVVSSLQGFFKAYGTRMVDWCIDYCQGSSRVKLIVPKGWEPDEILQEAEGYKVGYYIDAVLADSVKASVKSGETDLEAMLIAAFYDVVKSVQADYEYQTSDEAISETCEANDYWFTEQGEID